MNYVSRLLTGETLMPMQFYLNGKPQSVGEFSGETTLLNYLREQMSLNGSKEGCASGDCGACTVLIGEQSREHYESTAKWQFEAVNGCITLLAQVQDKQVVTVEGLRTGKALHPAQQAMVAHHASQCGFCTPGIVMAISALLATKQQQENQTINDAEIQDALSGNLCRCTGYRPIIDAARELNSFCSDKADVSLGYWHPDIELTEAEASTPPPQSIELSPGVYAPSSEKALGNLLATYPKARLVAGATDLALEATQQYQQFDQVVLLQGVSDLNSLHHDETHCYIGANTTYTQAEPMLAELYPEFLQLMQRLGSRQIRNKGTFGGNIANASPIGDTPPVFIALGAELELASAQGYRWLPVQDFFLSYKKTDLRAGEYIRRIKVPLLAKNEVLKVYKISKRLEDDISAVLMALKLRIENNKVVSARSGFGGLDGIPRPSTKLEQALQGSDLGEADFYRAGAALEKDFKPLDDVRASAEYRLGVCRDLLRKCALELTDTSTLTRVENLHTQAPEQIATGDSSHA